MSDRKHTYLSDRWNASIQPDIHDRQERFIFTVPLASIDIRDDETLSGMYESVEKQEPLFYYKNVKKQLGTLEGATPSALAAYQRRTIKGNYSRLRCVTIESIKFRRVNGFSESDWAMIGDTPLRRQCRLDHRFDQDAWFLLQLKDSGYPPEMWMQMPSLKQAERITYAWMPH